MSNKIKTIAFYLPQFHCIPENDAWWGKGFTEWVNVKKAISLFDNHNQPRVPLDNNYYDLSDVDVMGWQAKIAKEHGVYGFCFYHYWFGGKKLLEKPVENYLKDTSIDFPFCISWANEHWTNQWISAKSNVLIEQNYGNEDDWEEHFNYLLPYFKDERYIKRKGKPVIIIYRPELIEKRKEMIEFWRKLAIKNGLSGLCVMGQRVDVILNSPNTDVSMFNHFIEYQPSTVFVTNKRNNKMITKLKQIKRSIDYKLEKYLPNFKLPSTNSKNGLTILDYDTIWKSILDLKPIATNCIPCAFVDWDNTPRKGDRGIVVHNANPTLFEKYFKLLIQKTRNEYKEDMVFIFAWNEWAEGGYLEPDEKNGYGYLEAIKRSLD